MEAAMSHSESKRLYSWWWNSHISPKNSKWLQENLADMDGKVKAMIRIIEEDADSFARRAEMYYKKRPELMKLVEEFYRAYRALAERYDNATGVLRQAHRTMAVVFPNQLPPEEFSDEAPSDAEPMNSDMLAELFDSEGYAVMEMSGVFAGETDPESKLLRREIEVEHLKDEFFKERAEKEDALLRYNESLSRISYLEIEISRIQEELKRLNGELQEEAATLVCSKEQILALETANKSLELEMEKLVTSLRDERSRCAESEKHLEEMELIKLSLEEELEKIREENRTLNEQKLSSTMKIIDLQDEIVFLRELKGKLQDEVKCCREEKELLYQELCEVKEGRNNLEQTIQTHESEKVLYTKQYGESQEELRGLHEKLKEYAEKISNLQHDMICLNNLKEESEDELQLRREEQEQVQAAMKELRDRNYELDEAIKKQCSEYQEGLKEMELIRFELEEKLEEIKRENSRLNEQNLASAGNMINLQDEIICLENLKGRLEDEMKNCVGEKEVLQLKVETLRDRNDELDEAIKKQRSDHQKDLTEMELIRLRLEEKLEEIKQENSRLSEQKLSSTVKMITLQDEVICLRNLKGNLEDEIKSLKATIKELRDRNGELDETIKKQKSESQEELREMKRIKLSLEEEVEKIGQENSRLNEQNHSSTVKIINLQDDIIHLKNSKGRLEDEMRLCAGEKEVLRLELCRFEEDSNDSEHRLRMLQQQIQAVTSETEFFQAMIEDLKSGNDELKDTIKRHEHERVLQSQNTKRIQALSERNLILENSLAEANHELERLREKLKEHEESCKNLRSEKTVLVSHMDAAARNIEKLLSKNSFMENSLSDVNAELDSLRGGLRILDESWRSLRGRKYSLLPDKDTLRSKVESISCSLKNLENSFTESEREKASLIAQVAELQEFLRSEKEKHKVLIYSSKNQMSELENQIYHLERKSWEMEEELELEQQKDVHAQLEIFILRRCLRNIKEESLGHSTVLQKQQEALKSAEKLVVELKQECLLKEKMITCSAQQKEKLREWIVRILRMLEIDLKYASSDDVKDEFLLQLILCEVRHLLNTISEARDEKQILILEKSVVVTLLEQFGLYVRDLRAEVMALDRESKLKEEDLAALRGENDKILETNKQLKEKLQVENQREELLNTEMDILFSQLSQLQESHRKLQIENSRMSKEKQVLSKKLKDLRSMEGRMEEEISIMIAGIMTSDILSVALKNHLAERRLEITEINKKLEALQLENRQLRVSFANLEECRRCLSRLGNDLKMATRVMNVCEQLNQQTHSGNDLLLEKDSELIMEFERTKKDVNKLRNKEENLISNGLQESTHDDELKSSEAEVSLLLNDIQCATISATLFRQKVIELILTCESIERSAMLHRKVLHEEIMLKDASVDELKEKVDALEIDNKRLKEELDAYMSLLGTFWDDVSILEEQALSLGKSNKSSPNKQGKQGNQLGSVRKKSQELEPAGIMELRELQAKIRGLQKLVRDTRSLLELERLDSNASIEAARKEIEALRSRDNRKVKYEKIMRDIKLDVVLNSSKNTNNIHYHGARRKGNANQTSENKLEMWGTTTTTTRTTDEGDSSSNQKQKSPLLIEEVEANHPSSDPVSEKELGVDKLEVHKTTESLLEWQQRITVRLSSDSQRLLVLHTNLQETHKSIEAFEKSSNSTTWVELENVKVQLKEFEGSISKLVDINSRLTKKAGDLAESSSEQVGEKDGGSGSRSRRLVSDRAEKMSEKIGKLELDLQNMKFALQRMEQEHINRKSSRVVEKSGILLKEYIYGRKEDRKKKRGCGCMRPKAKGD